MSAAAVECAGVWKFYGDYPALSDISVQIEPGTCLALIGRNGAGKTTLLRILAGFSQAGRGRVSVLGDSPRESVTRRRIGFLGHGISIYDELTAWENLCLFGRIYGLNDPQKSAREWLDRTGLTRVKDGLAREFSRGMRQRLAVARAFLHDPSVLMLDEPFTSLDDRAIGILQGLLADALRAGRTVIMSTHQLREAMELATHVTMLQRGKIAYHGPRTPEMLDDPGWLYAQHGEAG